MKSTEFVHFANRLGALLKNHIYKEDTILFDIVEKSLSKENDEAVVAELNKFEAPVGLYRDLYRLEWKYLTKTA